MDGGEIGDAGGWGGRNEGNFMRWGDGDGEAGDWVQSIRFVIISKLIIDEER